jgi:serine/threonine-protein kinase RsbW
MNNVSNQIIISSAPENLAVVEKYIEDVCMVNNIGPDVFGNILITTTEAVNNAILHGNKKDECKMVEVSYDLDLERKTITFKVKDEGKGFDYNNLPDPTAPENIHMTGGRGVFLIKQLADFVIFSDNGSVLELEFKL